MRDLEYIAHHGIKGQKWGVRRFQNKDGSLTKLGQSRNKVAKKYSTTKTEEANLLNKYKGARGFIMSKEDHYKRNELNSNLPNTAAEAKEKGWHTVIANAHQFTNDDNDNIKYVSPDGKQEAVYDKKGNMIKNALDMGSYNYCPSEKSYYGHFKYDIMPWIMYGNAADDPSTVGQRIVGIFGHYNKKAARLGQEYMDQVSGAFDNVRMSDIMPKVSPEEPFKFLSEDL